MKKEEVTLEKYLEACRIIGDDVDIQVDGFDSIAYCGEKLTEEGQKHFAKALSLPMYKDEDGRTQPCVVSSNDADYDEDNEDSALELAWDMLCAMAGYCSCDDFHKWIVL